MIQAFTRYKLPRYDNTGGSSPGEVEDASNPAALIVDYADSLLTAIPDTIATADAGNSGSAAQNSPELNGPNATGHLIFNFTFAQAQSSLPAGFVGALNYVNTYFSNLIRSNITINAEIGYQVYDNGTSVPPNSGVENPELAPVV